MDVATVLNDWSAGRGPLHQKLASALERAIRAGEIGGGERLPSERSLAERLVVSRSTVVAAYAALVQAGLAESRHGSGTYVARQRRLSGRTGAEAAGRTTPLFQRLLAGEGGSDVISFASSTVPLPAVLRAAMEATVEEDLGRVMGMPGHQPLGLRALREAVAEMLSRRGLPSTAQQILITTGAHQALNLCAALFVRPGDWVAVEDPTYPGCIDAFAAAGGRLATLDVDHEGVSVDSVAAVVGGRSVVAICTTPTYHNPTGTVLADYRRRRLVELAAEHRAVVVEDLVLSHARLTDDAPPLPIAAYRPEGDPPVITVGSTSKVFWSGLRVGWIRAPEPWIGRLARRKVAADLGSSLFDQAVAARLYARLDEVENELRAGLTSRLRICEEALGDGFHGWTWERPAGGASLWVRLPADAARFSQVALRHGVDVIPGSAFSTGDRWSEHLRIPFGLEPDVLEVALDRLRCAWAAYRPDMVIERRLDDPAMVV